MIEMIVFRLVRELGLLEKRGGKRIGFVEEFVDCLTVERVRDDEIAVVGE